MENLFSIKITDNTDGKSVEIGGNVPLLQTRSNGAYLIQCPVLKTVGYSKKSYEDAVIDHRKDLEIFFSVHLKRGTLKSALKALGWFQNEKNEYETPKIPSYLLNRLESSAIAYRA